MFPTHIVAAGGIIIDKKEQVLLVKSPHRGWEFPGGQVENGENLLEAVKREIIEEANVEVEVQSLIGVYSNVQSHLAYDGKTVLPTKVMFDFICEYISGEFKPSNETLEGKWVHKDKVLDYIEHPAYIYRYQCFLRNLNRPVYSYYKSKPFKVIGEIIV